jgi:signal transduction histidine kinase
VKWVWSHVAIAAGAVLAAVAAVWVTLEAGFLAYPGWLAVQKADFILGPVLVGLYWLHRRPQSRFGPMLIGFGFISALYVFQSARNSWLFTLGLLAETAIGIATRALILAFPTGRLDRPAKAVLVISILVSPLPSVVSLLVSPQTGAGASISGCRVTCPVNELAVTSNPELAADLLEGFRFGVILASALTAGLLVWRFAQGTPPQRRALAVGIPIALVFLGFQITFQLLGVIGAPQSDFSEFIKWGIVGARAALWYGFFAALIAAELFAARAVQAMLRRSLQRPSQRDLQAMLSEPLGDPRLRLLFRDQTTGAWVDADGEKIALPTPGSGLALTVVEHRQAPAVALVHDAQLNDDPELLEAAGGVALLAAENAELDAASNGALLQLRRSRERLVRAGDSERRKVERNLHDGVQQRLAGIRVKLVLAVARAGSDELRRRLEEIGRDVDDAVEELREVAHGLYPPVLREGGLVAALDHLKLRVPIAFEATDVSRHSPELESAVFYCCLEAIQNAIKHGGPGTRIAVEVGEDADQLSFRVSDDGPGFDLSRPHFGTGLQNMRDRVGALDGRVTIVTAVGQGTTVSGFVPLGKPLSAVEADDEA